MVMLGVFGRTRDGMTYKFGSDNACEQMLAQISKDSINNQTMEQISVIIKKI